MHIVTNLIKLEMHLKEKEERMQRHYESIFMRNDKEILFFLDTNIMIQRYVLRK